MNKEDLIAPKHYNIVNEIEKHASDKTKKALIYYDTNKTMKEVTYDTLVSQSNKLGNVLLNHGLKKGDKLLVMVPRIIDAYEVYIAALKCGIIIIPSSEMLTANDLQYRIDHGEVNGIICFHAFTDAFDDVTSAQSLKKFVLGERVDGWIYVDELKEDASNVLATTETLATDIAFLPYTSGTTGLPKAVVHEHSWGYAHIRTVAENWLGIRNDDIVWATAGPGWQKWVWSPFLSVLATGSTGFVYNGRFDAETYLQLLEAYKINVLCCTPTEYRMIAKYDGLDQFSLTHLREALSAGEPLNREVIDTFRETFDITVRDGYGQTENTLLLGIMKNMDIRPGSMGKPTPGNDVAIIDEDANEVSVGVTGDIAVKRDCPALFREYFKDEERTKVTKRGEYYVTGDRASMDKDGYFWFQGRNDDIIISSGYTIGPFEVEDALTKHDAIQECAVVGAPDDIRGQIVKAFIVLKESRKNIDKEALVKELQAFVKRETAPYKYPRAIEFIDELPKTPSGKVRRVELRENFS